MVLLLKGGAIGKIKSLRATCTSLQIRETWSRSFEAGGGAMTAWAPYILIAALRILGDDFIECGYISCLDEMNGTDLYTRIDLLYPGAEASLTAGTGVKSEGDLVVSGTGGYVYVPAPWWKMDYFEIRKEDSRANKRYFYQFEGEGMRYELAEFLKSIRSGTPTACLSKENSCKICEIVEKFRKNENVRYI